MRKRYWLSTFGLLAVSAGLVIACGDDEDDANATDVTPDASNGVDASTETPDSATDAATPVSQGLVAKTSLELPNAIDPYGLVYASDGFLYASGSTKDGVTQKLAVWRFKDGALDTTFGTGGVLTTDIAGDELSYDIVEVSAGFFVVQAVSGGKVYLVKLTKDAGGVFTFGTPEFIEFGYAENEAWPDGTPSPPAGIPQYNSWGIGVDRSVASTPKIVVFAFGAPAKAAVAANQRTADDRWIARVLPSTDHFENDDGFNAGEPWSADADGKNIRDNARRGLVLPDGTIVSAGYTDFGSKNNVVMIRLKPDGTPDTTFGFGVENAATSPGQTRFNPFSGTEGFAEAYAVVRQSTGRLVTTGYGTSNFDVPSKGLDLVSFGLNADGLDTTYGKLGSFVVQSETTDGTGQFDAGATPWEDRGRDLAVLSDDRVVHAGLYDLNASIFVSTKDGKLDPSTADGGALTYPWRQAFFKVVVSPDGKTVAATAKSLRPGGDASAALGSFLVTLGVGQ